MCVCMFNFEKRTVIEFYFKTQILKYFLLKHLNRVVYDPRGVCIIREFINFNTTKHGKTQTLNHRTFTISFWPGFDGQINRQSMHYAYHAYNRHICTHIHFSEWHEKYTSLWPPELIIRSFRRARRFPNI